MGHVFALRMFTEVILSNNFCKDSYIFEPTPDSQEKYFLGQIWVLCDHFWLL